MKVIIAGSRSITNPKVLHRAICDALGCKGIEITELVCGMAPGVDMLGWNYAKANNIPIKEFPAKWYREDGSYNKYAGPQRNIEMGIYCDAAILIWDSQSSGTYHMLEFMNKINKPYYLMTPYVKIYKKDK